MKLIMCPECKCLLYDAAKVCPECGYPTSAMTPDNTHLQELVDAVYCKCNGNRSNAAKELQKRTGMKYKQAMFLIQQKHLSPEVKSERERIHAENKEKQKQLNQQIVENFEKLGNAFGRSKVPHCPRCKSTSISYQDKISYSRAAVGGILAGGTGAVLGGLTGKKGYAVCLNCGKRWKI